MDDLISREDALERLRSISADLGRRELDDAINAIENMPSEGKAANSITIELSPEQIKKYVENAIVDIIPYAQPERTGRWYKPQGYSRDSYRFICDNCHDVAYFVTGNNGKKNKSDIPKCGYRFCPNCGAKMEAEHETN